MSTAPTDYPRDVPFTARDERVEQIAALSTTIEQLERLVEHHQEQIHGLDYAIGMTRARRDELVSIDSNPLLTEADKRQLAADVHRQRGDF